MWSSCKPGGTNCPAGGTEINRYYGGGGQASSQGDAGLIHVNNVNTWPRYAGYWNWGPNGSSPLRSWFTSPAAVGTVGCLNGATSGSTCGTVRENDATVNYEAGPISPPATVTGMLRFRDACPRLGDSGGPWTLASYESAIGVHSGSGPPPGATGPLSGCGADAYVEPMNRPVSVYGLSVYGYP